MARDTAADREPAEAFRHYDADEMTFYGDINTVSGWVPAQNVEPLTDEVPGADVQYYSDDAREAFVTTL